jgi:hypothetical protein
METFVVEGCTFLFESFALQDGKKNTFCDKLIKIVENFERIQGLDILAEESQPSFLGTSYKGKAS